MSQIVLASTSCYRQELLSRLQLGFEIFNPQVDEAPEPDEPPPRTAERLAVLKAMAAVTAFPDALIIGSDQVAYAGDQVFGKPGSRDNAIRQLLAMSGRDISFHTGICLLNSKTGRQHTAGIVTEVGFRVLTHMEIERYLDKENALNCAGSAKSEGLGISLLRHIRGDDPTALVGLPLIKLCELLHAEGVALP